ncbi:7978_t:CDS:2 [Paraglomus occultum]|uniref:7978_t:CDS:1 n=1 Tax=Paraglomus occultum TaxID=144539 RepID=A0A9N9BQ15_9GLOM|nr:7978_t:CDS:2 [Paraglomus occultum]
MKEGEAKVYGMLLLSRCPLFGDSITDSRGGTSQDILTVHVLSTSLFTILYRISDENIADRHIREETVSIYLSDVAERKRKDIIYQTYVVKEQMRAAYLVNLVN